MAIVIKCRCGKELRAKDEAAGKKSKCPHCGEEVLIPSPSASAQPVAAGAASDGPSETLTFFEWGTGEHRLPDTSKTVRPPSDEGIAILPDNPAPATSRAAYTNQRYKVLSHKEMGFAIKFDPQKLEDTLNQMSEQGWRVVSTAVMEFAGHSGSHHELIVLLERL